MNEKIMSQQECIEFGYEQGYRAGRIAENDTTTEDLFVALGGCHDAMMEQGGRIIALEEVLKKYNETLNIIEGMCISASTSPMNLMDYQNTIRSIHTTILEAKENDLSNL